MATCHSTKPRAESATGLLPAACYIRMSGHRQEASPAQQRAEIAKLAKRHDCQIVAEFLDEAKTGDSGPDTRPGFGALLQAAAAGEFKAVLAWDQDRIGRFDSLDAGRWLAPLRDAGVRIVTVAQGEINLTTFAGRLVFSVTQEGKKAYLVDLSRNSMRGRIASAKQGKATARPSLGYDRMVYDDAGRVVKRVPFGEKFTKPKGWRVEFVLSADPEVVATVRWIFKTFAESDCSLNWLANELNERKPAGTPAKGWQPECIKYILQNPVYIGRRQWARKSAGKYHQVVDGGELVEGKGARTGRNKGDLPPPILVEGANPALIDAAIFEKVQAKLAARTFTKSKPRTSGFLLSRGLLKCGHCGGHLGGEKREGFAYYRCTSKGRASRDPCPSGSIPKDQIEGLVLEYVRERIFAPGSEKLIWEAAFEQAKATRPVKTDTRALESKVKALDKRIERGQENLLLADAADVPGLSKTLGAWRAERGALQDQIRLAQRAGNGRTPQQEADAVVEELKRIQDHFESGDPARIRQVIRDLVAEITVTFEPAGPSGRFKRVSRGVLVPVSEVGVIPTSWA